MSDVVFDASALMTLLENEPGRDEVAAALGGAAISAVNLAEVAGKLAERGMPEHVVRDTVFRLGLAVHPFDVVDALATGALRAKTREAGLSLGDRACLALASRLDRPALTADRSWKPLKVGVAIRLLRS